MNIPFLTEINRAIIRLFPFQYSHEAMCKNNIISLIDGQPHLNGYSGKYINGDSQINLTHQSMK